ncbi:MAG: MaoC family dehydratase [Lachnospiraceae bacterium]
MELAIKYCGGCNPTYDRGRRIEKFKKLHPEIKFVSPKEGELCDLWLIVCGCSRKCVSTTGMNARHGVEVLYDEAGFRKLEERLQQLAQEEVAAQTHRILFLGERASIVKKITQEDVNQFAAVTGDYNALHFNEEFAGKSFFGKRVVHGMLISSLVSTVMGMELPGAGTIFMKQETEFLKPVFVGDTIEAEVEFTGCDTRKSCYLGTFIGTCKNQNGEIVLKSECHQMMMKNLFQVEETGGCYDQSRKI